MLLVHWPLMGGLLHLVQRGGDWVGPQPTQAPTHCTKCNGTPAVAAAGANINFTWGDSFSRWSISYPGLTLKRADGAIRQNTYDFLLVFSSNVAVSLTVFAFHSRQCYISLALSLYNNRCSVYISLRLAQRHSNHFLHNALNLRYRPSLVVVNSLTLMMTMMMMMTMKSDSCTSVCCCRLSVVNTLIVVLSATTATSRLPRSDWSHLVSANHTPRKHVTFPFKFGEIAELPRSKLHKVGRSSGWKWHVYWSHSTFSIVFTLCRKKNRTATIMT